MDNASPSADSGAGFTMAQLRDCHVAALERVLLLATRPLAHARAAVWDDEHEVYVSVGSPHRSRARHAWSMIAAACTASGRAVVLSEHAAAIELRIGQRRCRGMLALWNDGGTQLLSERRELIEGIAAVAEAQCELYRAVVGMRIAILDVAAQAVASSSNGDFPERRMKLPTALPRGAIFVFDRELRYHVAEGELLDQWARIPRELILGRTLHEVVSPANQTFLERLYRDTLAGEALRFEVGAEGRTYEAQSIPIRGVRGDVTRGVLLVHDISDLKQLEARLSQSANPPGSR